MVHMSWRIPCNSIKCCILIIEVRLSIIFAITKMSTALFQSFKGQACLEGTLLNSLRLSDTYMHHQSRSSLVQIMACRLVSAKPLSEPILEYFQLDDEEQISVKSYQNSNIFIQQNAFKNVVCEMAFCLSFNVLNYLLLVWEYCSWIDIFRTLQCCDWGRI